MPEREATAPRPIRRRYWLRIPGIPARTGAGNASEEIVMFRRTRLWVVLVIAIGMAALLAMPEIAHAGLAAIPLD
jgi:hypothetical protein